MANQRAFYFLHIPKTAGTTLNFSVFPQAFAAAEICPAYSYRQLLEIDRAEVARFRLFRGHFYYSLHRLLPKEPVYMTFLRDPLERVLSLYDYVLREPDHYQHHLVRALKGGVREFAQSPELLVSNFQLLALARDVDITQTAADAQRSRGAIDADTLLIDQMRELPVTNDDLRVARRRLEEFPFVGITERFEESVTLLCRTFGWRAISRYDSLNVAPASRIRRDSLPADVVREIVRSHEPEFELYEHAKSLFCQRLSA